MISEFRYVSPGSLVSRPATLSPRSREIETPVEGESTDNRLITVGAKVAIRHRGGGEGRNRFSAIPLQDVLSKTRFKKSSASSSHILDWTTSYRRRSLGEKRNRPGAKDCRDRVVFAGKTQESWKR